MNMILFRRFLACFFMALPFSAVIAQDDGGVQEVLVETQKDLPGHYHPEFGMPPGSKLAESLQRLSKIDLDTDLNYDGAINNEAEDNQGALEHVPPGFQIGVGELSKMVIRFKTYEKDYPGELYVRLDVDGVNRFAGNGDFKDEEEIKASTGRIRVWRDREQTELLIDSDDPEKRFYEWKIDKELLGTGLPGVLPRTLYLEGVEASNKFEGDLRLLLSSSHSLSTSEPRQPSSTYSTAYDHTVVTVREEPIAKEFINNNAEGVWLTVAGDESASPDESEEPEETGASEGSAEKDE
ncbi:MAG: hypothetical protein P1U85_17660 [Verrucomicrobiales bacterium]|nr:hypothetical protein [Verrucomicrobiales bacterium]